MKHLAKIILLCAVIVGFFSGKVTLEWSIGAVIVIMILF